MGVTFLAGSKGGVGKSLLSALALECEMERGPILIDTDTDNPDVYIAYQDVLGKDQLHAITLDTSEGWQLMLNVIGDDANRNRPIIVNTAARNTAGIREYGATLNMPETRVLWAITQNADSLDLFHSFMQIVNKPACVVKNQLFSARDSFGWFDGSDLGNTPSVTLKHAPDIAMDVFRKERKPLGTIHGLSAFGDRVIGEMWLDGAMRAVAQAVDACGGK